MFTDSEITSRGCEGVVIRFVSTCVVSAYILLVIKIKCH